MQVWHKSVLALLFSVASGLGAASFLVGPDNLIGMLRYDQRRDGDLAVGHKAPDVALVALDGTTPVRLSEHIGGKPTILVFGSFT